MGDVSRPERRRVIFFRPLMDESINVIWVLETWCVGPALDELVPLS